MGSAWGSAARRHDVYTPYPVAFDDLAPSLDTGDVLLMCGNGVGAHLIRLLLWTNYSHVGIVHRREFADASGQMVSELCLWESAGHDDGLVCLLHGRRKGGVRLVRLRDRIESYMRSSWRGLAYVCVVKLHATEEKLAKIAHQMCALEDRHCGLAYNSNPLHLAAAGFPGLFGPTHPSFALPAYAGHALAAPTPMTCNELVALTLVSAGICRSWLPVGAVTEQSFINGDIGPHFLEPGVSMGTENYHWTINGLHTQYPAYQQAPSPPPARREQYYTV